MPVDIGWRSLGLTMYAVFQIGDATVHTSVMAYQDDYALNGIPTGRLVLPVGRSVDGAMEVSHAYAIRDQKLLIPAAVYIKVTPRAQDLGLLRLGSWPAGYFRIFTGYAIGAGEDRTLGKASLVVGLLHWLSDMSMSSMVSRSSSPTNPADFSFGSVCRLGGAGGGTHTLDPAIYFVSSNLSTDIWGYCLYPWLKELASQDRLWFSGQLARAANIDGPGVVKNKEAMRSLLRFEGSDNIEYKYAGPVTLSSQELLPQAATSISSTVWRGGFDAMATTTMWDKLVGDICPTLLLSVVPMVDRALLVPYVPGLRDAWTTIGAHEYHALRNQYSLPRPLRAVVLFNPPEPAPTNPTTSAAGGAPGSLYGIGGWYESTNPAYAEGVVLFKSLPTWLNQLMSSYGFSRAAALNLRAAAAAPDAAAKPAANADSPGNRSVVAAPTLWNSFAKSLYATEVLRGRMMVLSGPLRFDIAPGSTVVILTREDDFVAAQLAAQGITSNGAVFADVLRVTSVVDREAGRAETMLQLGHVRTYDEALDATGPLGLDEHPLWTAPSTPFASLSWPASWTGVFRGAPLVDDPAFDYRS